MDKKSIIIVIMIFVVLFSVGVDILMMLALRETKTQVMIHEATTQEMIGKKFTIKPDKMLAVRFFEDRQTDKALDSFDFNIEGKIQEGLASQAEGAKTLGYVSAKNLLDTVGKNFAEQLLAQSDLWRGAKVLSEGQKSSYIAVLRAEAGVLILMVTPEPEIAGNVFRIDVVYRFHAAPVYVKEGEQRWEGILKPVTTQPAGE